MHVENTEDLKVWLTSCLVSMCDAEPTALAKYVLALIKKQKSEQELKEFCLVQLNIFLLENTKHFVDMLFEVLRTKSYLQSNASENTNSFISENNQKMVREETCHIPTREEIPSNQIKHEYDQQKYREDNLSMPHSSLQSRLYSNERVTENSHELNHSDIDMRLKDSTNFQMSRRCRSYDEKGYCIQGGSCIYDHGFDPVVVEGAVPELYDPEDPFMSAEDRANYLSPSNPTYKPLPVSHSVPNIQPLSHNSISKKQPIPRELIVVDSAALPMKNVTAAEESKYVNSIEMSSVSTKQQKDFNYSKVGSRPKKMTLNRLSKPKHITKQLNTGASVNKYSLNSGTIPQTHVNLREKRLKIQLELHEKMQIILQSQLEYQKFVLEKLSQSKNKKEKVQLKQVLEHLAPNITALQVDVRKSSEDLKNFIKMCNSDASNPEKELLDAEMDLFNKQQHGDDHAAILAKVNRLKHKAKAFEIANSHKIGARKGRQYSPNAQFTNKGGVRNSSTALKLDNRPKTIFVSKDYGVINIEDASKYFGKSVEKIEKIQAHGTGYAVTFNTRKAAEMALLDGYKLGEESLKIAWLQEDQQSKFNMLSGGNTVAAQSNNIHYMDDDDEDDDEDQYEARSWRW